MEILIIVIGIVLIIALEIIFNLNKKRIPDKLTQLLLEHRFDEFDALMDKKTTKLFEYERINTSSSLRHA